MSYPSRESAQARHEALMSALTEVRHQAEELYGQVNAAITRAEAAEARVAELEAREKTALDLLAQVQCQICGGGGIVCGVGTEYDSRGNPYPVQVPEPCDWCQTYAALTAKEG